MKTPRLQIILTLLIGGLIIVPVTTLADQTTTQLAPASQDTTDSGGLKQEVDQLNDQVKQKEQHIKDLNGMIDKYKQKITDHESQVVSLQNEVALLDNRIAEKQLDTERAKSQIDLVNLQIRTLKDEISAEEQKIAQRQDSLADLIRQIQEADSVSAFDVLVTRPSLSEFFARLEEVKRLESELSDATERLKQSHQQLQEKQKELEADRQNLQDQSAQLQKDQTGLEQDRAAQTTLISETQNREDEFQRILYELRQQQQSDANNIANLQDTLKDRLDSIDTALARGDILLSWPIPPLKGISAKFHDPSYPFRKLFEHPGIDIPTDVGTPVKVAAGGYVAWTRTGKQYGNYIMVVHPGGIATIYAHLSRFGVKPDTYVDRGDVIGYSGGRPGDEGAGLSTGAHLHFEVRQNGIPVNPENFLPSLD